MRLVSTLLAFCIFLSCMGSSGAGPADGDDTGKKDEAKRVIVKSLKFDPRKIRDHRG